MEADCYCKVGDALLRVKDSKGEVLGAGEKDDDALLETYGESADHLREWVSNRHFLE